jgi:alpha-tubulin suppressor-like RCC1 family protein
MKRALLWLALAGCTNDFVVLAPDTHDGGDAGGAADADIGDYTPSPNGEAGASDAASDAARDGAIDAASEPVRQNVRAVGAFAHTCAASESALFCWGSGSNEQFGVSGGADQPAPQRLLDGMFVATCTGERHACALHGDGTLYCWGGNREGQLGLGDRMTRARPTALPNRRFSAVACGGYNTCAIESSGALSCWGDNLEGTLGQGDAQLRDSPNPVRVPADRRVSEVSVGQAHACRIDETGELACWGRNTFSQTGTMPGQLQARAPTTVDEGRRYTKVAAAQNHTCAIARDGRLYCWGDYSGALLGFGMGGGDQRVNTPMQVGTSTYVAVSANWFHTCAIEQSGALYCWGRNDEQQIVASSASALPLPMRVGSASDFRAVATGQFHTCAIRSSGLYCWGENGAGQLGLPGVRRDGTPMQVVLPP